jgi:class 3 adenylate cyclase
MPDRRIATVLMLDVVGSTHVAAQMGDARYRELSSRFNRLVRAELKRFRGKEEDHAGDGFFATFSEPDRAIRCAAAIAEAVRGLGIEIRSGIHTGQTEDQAGKTHGIAVVIGARVMSLADAGDILVTSTTKELVTGSGFGFDDFSAHELKGVPGTWQVFAVTGVNDELRTRPLPAAEAAERRAAIEPSAQRDGPRRRAILGVGGLAGLLVIASVALAVSGRDDETPPPTASDTPLPESIVQVDPSSGAVLDEVPAPVPQRGLPGMQRGTPDHAMVVGEGGVWTLRSARWLYQVDGLTHELRQRITLETGGVSFSLNVAAGLDEVWVVSDRGLIEVDPATGDQRHVVDFAASDAPLASDLTVGGGYVWVASSPGSLLRFDPRTERSRTFEIGGSTESIAFGHGSVWIGDTIAGTVTSYDADSLRSDPPISLSQGVDHVVVGSSVWVLSRRLGVLTPIDPTTGRVGQGVPVGDAPTGIAAGGGAIWVGDEDGVIRRVDDILRQVTEVPFGPAIRTLAFDDETDTLWVDVA